MVRLCQVFLILNFLTADTIATKERAQQCIILKIQNDCIKFESRDLFERICQNTHHKTRRRHRYRLSHQESSYTKRKIREIEKIICKLCSSSFLTKRDIVVSKRKSREKIRTNNVDLVEYRTDTKYCNSICQTVFVRKMCSI